MVLHPELAVLASFVQPNGYVRQVVMCAACAETAGAVARSRTVPEGECPGCGVRLR
jgi:Na+-translocating ferredoxin:NAD+ oxidoreductase RnfG subunit